MSIMFLCIYRYRNNTLVLAQPFVYRGCENFPSLIFNIVSASHLQEALYYLTGSTPLVVWMIF